MLVLSHLNRYAHDQMEVVSTTGEFFYISGLCCVCVVCVCGVLCVCVCALCVCVCVCVVFSAPSPNGQSNRRGGCTEHTVAEYCITVHSEGI